MAKKAVTSEILNIVPIDLSYLNDRGITEDCLAGKTAVVTGGASNVGLGYARFLALRLSDGWRAEVAAMQRWFRDEG